jgi:hypothetical protein
MSSPSLRAAMVPITRRIRAYFAPVNRETETPAVFDPGKHGAFLLDSPPTPWVDLGWIDHLQRFCNSSTGALRSSSRGAAMAQFRGPLDARVEFDFREWGKLQMALASGAEHMNVLASDPNADAQPSGGTAVVAAAVLPGSTATEVVVGVGTVDTFEVGDVLAVDADYQQQTGYVGTGIAAAYVNDPADINRDANYVRRVTFNLGRVAEKTVNSLLLAQPLRGGRIGRPCVFLLSAASPAVTVGSATAGQGFQREENLEIAKPIGAMALRAAFVALPHTDENDAQLVLCYRSYFPSRSAALY